METASIPTLYLIPVSLSDAPVEHVIPNENIRITTGIKYFIVENIRTARRFLKKCDSSIDIDSITFYELNKHTDKNVISTFLKPLKEGHNMGVMSEAGCPGVADPGSDVVAIAHSLGFKVTPLVGPSSILMSVMASGFNGQSFAFNGYLPIDKAERVKAIKYYESKAYSDSQTQIFIETPYRNIKLVEEFLQHCKPQTLLCIAMDITSPDEYIVTKRIKDWKGNLPDMNKKPAVFIIYKN